jgi:signal transduction histidine kinase
VNGAFDLLGPNNGLPSDRIGAITEDDFGSLWLNVDTSLVRLGRDEFDRAIHNSGYRPKYNSYDASDGLSGAAIVNLRAARAADGTLWFVRGGGLTGVDPRRLAAVAPQQAHATRIDTVAADDLTLPPANGGVVPAGTKTVQISYSALELTSPQRLRFRYRLDGFDSDWIAAGTVRQARYTNLPPGNYTFRVEAQAAGDGSVESSAWRFSLAPRFNQTPQFYALIAGVLLALLYAAWRIRLRVVQHEFSIVLAERTRLSREMHDTLLQSLVGLTLQIDKAVRLVRTSPASAADQLVRMRKLVESNIRDARTSIWELRSPVVESRDLVTALSELGQRMAGDENVTFSAEAIGTPRHLPANVKTNLLRIGQEAIANALRHAVPTRIGVEVRFDPDGVTLRVVDDGRGFTPHFSGDAAGHYGLLNMRDRAKEIGGVLTISSTPAAGSVVEARIPLEEWPLEVRQRTA